MDRIHSAVYCELMYYKDTSCCTIQAIPTGAKNELKKWAAEQKKPQEVATPYKLQHTIQTCGSSPMSTWFLRSTV